MRVYIGGPMTGLPENNYPAFRYAFRRLRDAGFDIVSPHLLEANITVETRPSLTKEKVYRLVLPGDIAAISICDAMAVLPGYENSKGTAFEMHAARLFGMPIIIPPIWYANSKIVDLEPWMDGVIALLQEAAVPV